jgi:hypothetical protein
MRLWFACCALVVASAQEPSLIDKIKARAGENLRRLPNYTCVETIERFTQRGRFGNYRHKDTLHLDVVYVGGEELFGLSGKGGVEHSDLKKMIGGTIENGQFALFLRSIFLSGVATFTPVADANLKGHPSHSFDYIVPQARSAFHIGSRFGQAIVGYSGRFWVDPDTLDLMRLVVSADNVPPAIRISSDVTAIDYGQVQIADKPFLLPVRSGYEVTDGFAYNARNLTTFEHCHQYIGESVLKLDPEPAPPPK